MFFKKGRKIVRPRVSIGFRSVLTSALLKVPQKWEMLQDAL